MARIPSRKTTTLGLGLISALVFSEVALSCSHPGVDNVDVPAGPPINHELLKPPGFVPYSRSLAAADACLDLAEGAECEYGSQSGVVSGSCHAQGEQLVCR